jgi:hypothetical protein
LRGQALENFGQAFPDAAKFAGRVFQKRQSRPPEKSRNDSGKKMVLVGKTDWSGTRRLRYFGKS